MNERIKYKMDINLLKSISVLLDQHPVLSAARILVADMDDEIVLKGTTDSLIKKVLAGEIAQQNSGSKNVINQINVIHSKTDDEILSAITACYQTNFGDSYLNIEITVKDGFVILDGQMKWNYQMQLATDCIREIPGINSIINNITVPPSELDINAEDILKALGTEKGIKISNIQVEVSGHKIFLRGMVDSEEQKIHASAILRRIPGVLVIENGLCIN